jgi:hypothetical protein
MTTASPIRSAVAPRPFFKNTLPKQACTHEVIAYLGNELQTARGDVLLRRATQYKAICPLNVSFC